MKFQKLGDKKGSYPNPFPKRKTLGKFWSLGKFGLKNTLAQSEKKAPIEEYSTTSTKKMAIN